MKKNWKLFLAIMLPVIFISQGCILIGTDGGHSTTTVYYGSIEVNWTFDMRAACPPDVVEVDVILFDDFNKQIKAVTVQCEDGKLIIDGVETGSYTILLKGVDEDGAVTWESDPVDIMVRANQTVVVDVDLTPA